MAVQSFQIAFLGLSMALVLFPILHRARWEPPWIRGFLYIPLGLVLLGLSLSGLALMGMQTMFFGFGFHTHPTLTLPSDSQRAQDQRTGTRHECSILSCSPQCI